MDWDQLNSGLSDLADALRTELTSSWFYIQIGVLAVAALAAISFAAVARRKLDPAALTMNWPGPLRLMARRVASNVAVIVFIIVVFIAQALIARSALPSNGTLLSIAASLATAWLVIHILASVIRNKFLFRLVALLAWIVTALSILGLTEATTATLGGIALTIGGFRLSLLLIVKLIIMMMVALWAASVASNFIEGRLRHSHDLTPSVQVLIAKVVRLALIAMAILVVVGSAGVDLTALAWFSGAIGVGIGLGLQKIVSNIVSGIVLLSDKSIKPGDIITVGESFGAVSVMGARYISVATRDGREILIPNEDLVTKQVVNWSYTKNEIRVEIKFSVDPACDPHRVRDVAIATAGTIDRVLEKLPVACHFMALDSRSMDFSLRFWIDDPVEGVTNIRGAVMLALWDAFKRESIAFPSPVQDVRLRDTAKVAFEERDAAGEAVRNPSGAPR